MIMNISSFRMLSHMQTNYNRCWIEIRFDKSSKKKRRRINNNMKTLISLIIKIKIILDYKIKLKINKINEINNRTSVKIFIKIHKTHNEALNVIKADQKNISLVKNLNTAWKIISVLIMIILIIQNMIASDHLILIKLSSKMIIKSNHNLSESTLINTWKYRLYVLAVSAIMIIVIIMITTFILLMNLNLTSKDHANDQKTN